MSTESPKAPRAHKRINFFKGFLTTEHDWNDAEAYHIEKRRLHQRLAHAPGVVPQYGGDLKVIARSRGDLSFEVQPGYAVDGEGRDLVLWEPQIKTIVPEEYKLPATLYVVLRYTEELTDFIAYKENLEYKGHRRVAEGARIEVTQVEPDITQVVELGRVFLEKGATRIRDARTPTDPKPNEIDLRFVPRAGVIGSFLAPGLRQRLADVIANARKAYVRMGRDGKIVMAHSALATFINLGTLDAADVLDQRNLFDIFGIAHELQAECATEIEIAHPSIAQRKEFADYRKHLEALKSAVAGRRGSADALTDIIAYQARLNELVLALFGGAVIEMAAAGPAPEPTPRKETPSVAGLPAFEDWEQVKGISSEELPNEIAVNGVPWVIVDRINVMDKDSEEAHQLQILDAKDAYRSRQKLKYPDGTVLEDVGRAHVGGYAQFQAKNLTPGKALAVVRRIDYVYGDYELEFIVDGKSGGVSSNAGTDRVNRWRNWPHVIPGDVVTKAQVTIKQAAVTAGRDINMFRYWFYQPK